MVNQYAEQVSAHARTRGDCLARVILRWPRANLALYALVAALALPAQSSFARPAVQVYDAATNTPFSAIIQVDEDKLATKSCPVGARSKQRSQKGAVQRFVWRAKAAVNGARVTFLAGAKTENCPAEFPVEAILETPADKSDQKSGQSKKRAKAPSKVRFVGVLAQRLTGQSQRPEYDGVLFAQSVKSKGKQPQGPLAGQLIIHLTGIEVTEKK